VRRRDRPIENARQIARESQTDRQTYCRCRDRQKKRRKHKQRDLELRETHTF